MYPISDCRVRDRRTPTPELDLQNTFPLYPLYFSPSFSGNYSDPHGTIANTNYPTWENLHLLANIATDFNTTRASTPQPMEEDSMDASNMAKDEESSQESSLYTPWVWGYPTFTINKGDFPEFFQKKEAGGDVSKIKSIKFVYNCKDSGIDLGRSLQPAVTAPPKRISIVPSRKRNRNDEASTLLSTEAHGNEKKKRKITKAKTNNARAGTGKKPQAPRKAKVVKMEPPIVQEKKPLVAPKKGTKKSQAPSLTKMEVSKGGKNKKEPTTVKQNEIPKPKSRKRKQEQKEEEVQVVECEQVSKPKKRRRC